MTWQSSKVKNPCNGYNPQVTVSQNEGLLQFGTPTLYWPLWHQQQVPIRLANTLAPLKTVCICNFSVEQRTDRNHRSAAEPEALNPTPSIIGICCSNFFQQHAINMLQLLCYSFAFMATRLSICVHLALWAVCCYDSKQKGIDTMYSEFIVYIWSILFCSVAQKHDLSYHFVCIYRG